ncbi:MAG: glycosyltransferase, partial [Clostridia bacterium]|nr:glycosyltransferase [Clostridia bacterium]
MNILMALMSLDIGGAETHVAELSKELKRRGHNVIIASNGGVYVDELESFGIKHYKVPLQNKQPKNILSSISLLKKIIRDEKIDIVHSHARIPSFLLGKIKKNINFPFVTTAHWVFTTKYGLKYITDWGQRTLAVSEDIKKYLMDNYTIPENHITVTVNGIDTEKFSKKEPSKKLIKEFGIEEGDK